MIHLVDCGFYEFLKRTEGKRVYCFGAGKQFHAFMENYGEAAVEGVIDNYRWMDVHDVTVGEKKVSILSVEQFVREYDGLCAVVITSQFYEEIVDQLDEILKLDKMDCYLDLFLELHTEHFNECLISDSKKSVIPKKIHYCWFGGGELPLEFGSYIESWKKYCPDYEIVRWDETNYDVSKNRYMKQAYDSGKWAFVSDYARVEVLYEHGGIYLDTDVELLTSFDEFLKWDMFCGFEDHRMVAWGLGFGAVKGLELLKEALEIYEARDFIRKDGSMDLTGCPFMQSSLMEKHGFRMNGRPQRIGNIAIYPKEFFAPFHHMEGFGGITAHTHSIHHYQGSWLKEADKQAFSKWLPLIHKVKNHELEQAEDKYYTEKNKTSKIKKFQIHEACQSSHTAGSKAPQDICKIAGKAGYQVIRIHPVKGTEGTDAYLWSKRQNSMDWDRCYESIPCGSVLLLQHPFWQGQEKRDLVLDRLKKEKKVSILSIVHDVEQLRGVFDQPLMQYEYEFMLRVADILIVHNTVMEGFFLNQGVPGDRMLAIRLFDYLSSFSLKKREFEPSILIAGNLDPLKSGYIQQLHHLTKVKLHLFGPNYSSRKSWDHIQYHGTFPPERIMEALEGAFGLVWDGDSLKTCSGETGNYLRYNNPHKLSLYLGAGIPVIIWKEAAQAAFVEQSGAGILIDSLWEIPDRLQSLTMAEYEQYVHRAEALSTGIRNGENTRTALMEAECRLGVR